MEDKNSSRIWVYPPNCRTEVGARWSPSFPRQSLARRRARNIVQVHANALSGSWECYYVVRIGLGAIWGDHGRRRSLHFTTPHFRLKKGWVYPLCPFPIQFSRARKFLETSGSGTQNTIQGTGVKRVTPTAERYCARDLASDYQYHGRQQEAPRIARTRDEMNAHRMLGAITAAVVVVAAVMSSVTHNMLSLPISGGASTRGVAASTRRITGKTLTSAALPIVLGVSTGFLSRPSKNFQIYVLRLLLAVNCSFAIAVYTHAA